MDQSSENLYFDNIYKFISIHSLKLVIENKTLRFTRGDYFNDPFESNPYLTPLDWNELYKNTKNKDIIKFIANQAFVKLQSKNYSSCFSKSYLKDNNKLMWAHYGDSHKGCCFEIKKDVIIDISHKFKLAPFIIKYVDNLAEKRDSLINDFSDNRILFLSTYKERIWEYEDEVRLLFHKEFCIKKDIKFVNNDANADIEFKTEYISKVIFGLKSDKNDIMNIINLFIEKKHIPEFYKIDINPFTLNLFEVNLNIKDYLNK
ncbi:DUF2971 domain-containing protein [Empedobacter sp. GD03797]|nr:DUF2971 domain-containing protein [Empedobacter sp. GD03797]MDH1882529.1 DUF2971 domain-containing protein [Empedobacter sp. GD03797]